MQSFKIKQHTLSDSEFRAISQVVYKHCGIDLKDDKKELVRSRLQSQVSKHDCSGYGDYLEYVLQDTSGPAFTTFINRISTNLTSFFREGHHFDFLKEQVFPAISKTSPVRLRAWSAGCSSGEEPYSIALSIAEQMSDFKRADIRVLASDISTAMLEHAAAGRYAEERAAGMAPALRSRYFQSVVEDGQKYFQVCADIRRLLLFKQINLMEGWPISTPLDFIFCRNVMIYFDLQTKDRLVNRFAEQLRPGGYLFIGHSESLSGLKHPLEYVAPTVYRKP